MNKFKVELDFFHNVDKAFSVNAAAYFYMN